MRPKSKKKRQPWQIRDCYNGCRQTEGLTSEGCEEIQGIES